MRTKQKRVPNVLVDASRSLLILRGLNDLETCEEWDVLVFVGIEVSCGWCGIKAGLVTEYPMERGNVGARPTVRYAII